LVVRTQPPKLRRSGFLVLLLLIAIAAAGLALSACGDDGPAGASIKIRTVSTTTYIDDWVREVGGDRVESFSLIPLGADPHTYQPGAGDISRIADASLVFKLGLTFESENFDRLLKNTVSDESKLVALGESAQPIPFEEIHEEHEEGEEEGREEEHGEFDPHFWFDPIRVRDAIRQIEARLSQTDPDNAAIYAQNAGRYIQELDELHQWILEQVAEIPGERRLLLTTHEVLGYFAHRYDFEVIGAVIPSTTTEQEPSAQDIARLVEEIREHNAPSIFSEITLSDRLAQSIARDAGATVVTTLHTESLGPSGSGADTYINMMRYNVQAIVDALK
jgi:zinc/manganese transport system substrate-binding protein